MFMFEGVNPTTGPALSPGSVLVWTRSVFVFQAAAAEAASPSFSGPTRVVRQGAAAAGPAVSPG